MQVRIFQDQSPKDRLQLLKDNAVKSEEMTYPRQLEDNEVHNLKDEYAKQAIDLAKEEEKKKEFMTDHKAVVKPIKLKLGEIMTQIRSRVEEITEDVYLMSDFDDNVMLYYNKDGVLVHSRPLLQNERQFSIIDNNLKKAK